MSMEISIKASVSLKDYTTFKIGGLAKYFVAVNNEAEILEALQFAKGNRLNVFLLGGGSNILVSDKGFDGLVIKTNIHYVNVMQNRMRVGAGVFVAEVVKKCAELGLSGMEWAAGLPGTIGGAIRGNAGTFGNSMRDVIEQVSAFDVAKNEFRTIKKDECEFGYRDSLFKNSGNLIIVSAVINLNPGNKDDIDKKISEIINWRRETFPEGYCAGSFFKHVEASWRNTRVFKKIPRFQELKLHEKKTIPSGFIIEEAGLKGFAVGGAKVSEKHANFILNTGNATAENVIMLSSIIKRKVRDEFGVQLVEEVELVGF